MRPAMDGRTCAVAQLERPLMPGGEVTSALTGAYPFANCNLLPERLAPWLSRDYGLGE